jgi:hypothetical protein
VYAHVAQRYAKADATVWEREVTDEALRGAVVGWWVSHYGDGNVFSLNVRTVVASMGASGINTGLNSRDIATEQAEIPAALASFARFPGPVIPRAAFRVFRCALGTERRLNVDIAARLGLVQRVAAAVAAGQRMTVATSKCAAASGSVPCLVHVRERGGPWDESVCAGAARGGHLASLQYAHEHGCPWNGLTCTLAASNGHVECLRYAHEQSCEWNEGTYAAARLRQDDECLKYVAEHGCPLPQRSIAPVALLMSILDQSQ